VLFVGRDRTFATIALLTLLMSTTNREGGPVTVRSALGHSAWTTAIWIAAAYLARAVGLPAM
jgi:hypothetical protein